MELYCDLSKESADEEIIGIPQKGKIHGIRSVKKSKEVWEYAVHLHDAERAGKHYDLRLGDPKSKHGHSWAVRHWPGPGEKRLAVRQSTHSLPYFDYEGRIESGYGKGDVSLHSRGKATVHASSNDVVQFEHKGQKYNLVKTGPDDTKWLLINRSEAR